VAWGRCRDALNKGCAQHKRHPRAEVFRRDQRLTVRLRQTWEQGHGGRVVLLHGQQVKAWRETEGSSAQKDILGILKTSWGCAPARKTNNQPPPSWGRLSCLFVCFCPRLERPPHTSMEWSELFNLGKYLR